MQPIAPITELAEIYKTRLTEAIKPHQAEYIAALTEKIKIEKLLYSKYRDRELQEETRAKAIEKRAQRHEPEVMTAGRGNFETLVREYSPAGGEHYVAVSYLAPEEQAARDAAQTRSRRASTTISKVMKQLHDGLTHVPDKPEHRRALDAALSRIDAEAVGRMDAMATAAANTATAIENAKTKPPRKDTKQGERPAVKGEGRG